VDTSLARWIGRVDGFVSGDDANALVVEEAGSCGGRRVDHGPRAVIAPVMAVSIAA
jgi:hypothetical protein